MGRCGAVTRNNLSVARQDATRSDVSRSDASCVIVSPAQIAGLSLWLTSQRIDTLFQDSALTTPVTADGDPVGGWKDLSGNNFHFTQATAGKRPVYKTTGVNSFPSLQFLVSAERHLVRSSMTIAGGDKTVFAVVNGVVGANYKYILDSVTGRIVMAFQRDTGDTAFFDGSWHGIAAATATPQLLVWHFSATTGTIYRNNTSLGSAVYSPRGMSLNASIGASFDGTLYFFENYMGEVGVYNRALQAFELSALYNYARVQWGL